MAEEQKPQGHLGGYLLGIHWLMVGPALLIACATVIGIQKAADSVMMDIVYGVILLTIIAARLVDRPPVKLRPTIPGSNSPALLARKAGSNCRSTDPVNSKLAKSESALGHCAFIAITAVVIWISVH